MIWLGIESSCDETACAVLQDEPLKVISNPLYSQIDEHALYGGVVPEIAARAHLQKIAPIAEAAVKEAGIELKDIDAIAYTTGPGLMGPLLVGASFARGLARDLQIPAYGINHLEGHLAAAWLSNPDIEPPFLTLTVSGGHTELVMEEPGFKYTSIGRTRDDAAGEAFDKCGKLLGWPRQEPQLRRIPEGAAHPRKLRILVQRAQDRGTALHRDARPGIHPEKPG